jgi:hypothetical protein
VHVPATAAIKTEPGSNRFLNLLISLLAKENRRLHPRHRLAQN